MDIMKQHKLVELSSKHPKNGMDQELQTSFNSWDNHWEASCQDNQQNTE